MRVALFTREYPPHVYGGAGVHVEYLSRELAGGGWTGRRRQAASFPRIGLAFARDHTSVLHACNVVARRRLDSALTGSQPRESPQGVAACGPCARAASRARTPR